MYVCIYLYKFLICFILFWFLLSNKLTYISYFVRLFLLCFFFIYIVFIINSSSLLPSRRKKRWRISFLLCTICIISSSKKKISCSKSIISWRYKVARVFDVVEVESDFACCWCWWSGAMIDLVFVSSIIIIRRDDETTLLRWRQKNPEDPGLVTTDNPWTGWMLLFIVTRTRTKRTKVMSTQIEWFIMECRLVWLLLVLECLFCVCCMYCSETKIR